MYLRKTIVLVALAALAATPSALAQRPPELGVVGSAVQQHQPAAHPTTKPKVKLPASCKRFGPYCFSASS
jgi:hypothetical protein